MLDIVETDPGTLDQTIYQHIVGVISKVAREPNMAADQLSNISSQYAYYYGIMIRAKRLLDDAEEAIESFKAASRTKKREEGGKLTAVAGEDYVNSLQETLDLNNEVNRLRESYGYAKGICGCLEMKKDMLVQLSANSRQESKLFQ
tara:strand:+ start:1792 stop:2229 length:438 start_codon:yes stop_codon:yes gene_type:complete